MIYLWWHDDTKHNTTYLKHDLFSYLNSTMQVKHWNALHVSHLLSLPFCSPYRHTCSAEYQRRVHLRRRPNLSWSQVSKAASYSVCNAWVPDQYAVTDARLQGLFPPQHMSLSRLQAWRGKAAYSCKSRDREHNWERGGGGSEREIINDR